MSAPDPKVVALTEAEREMFELIEHTGDTQGLAYLVARTVETHVAAVAAPVLALTEDGAWVCGVCGEGGPAHDERGSRRECAFEPVWKPARDEAAIKAEALREVAHDLDRHDDSCVECEPSDHITRAISGDGLRKRADRLETEAGAPS